MVPIDKKNLPVPSVLQTGHTSNKSTDATTALKAEYDAGERKFKFNSKIYGHKSVKEALIKAQNDKCCFCESYITHVAHGDVEHYRPKGGIQSSLTSPLEFPGYYWLAYDFDNLYFSCQFCNQVYKKNFFPLDNEPDRVRSHYNASKLKEEKPVIINPGTDNPALHIFFNREIPIGIDYKGDETILRTGLDREKLNDFRLKWLYLLDDIERHAKLGDQKSLQLLKEAAKPTEPYSLMVRCNYASLL
jgi:hypothetical protein